MSSTRDPNDEPVRGRSTAKARLSRREFATLTGVVLIAAACGSDSKGTGDVASTTTAPSTLPPTTAATTTTTTLPPTTTTLAATTTTTTTTTLPPTTAATTTLPPTTTVAPTAGPPTTLPVPEAVPADPRAAEAVINLGSIQIPAINIDKPMFEGVTLTTLDRGPGHWPGTAMPGQVGNVVIGGHRTSHDKPFRYVDKLVPGDEVVFNTADGRFVYHVVSTEIVFPDAIHIIDQTSDFTATLFACTPPGSTRQRIVIHLALAA